MDTSLFRSEVLLTAVNQHETNLHLVKTLEFKLWELLREEIDVVRGLATK